VPHLPWSLMTAGATLVATILHPAPPSRPPWYRTAPAVWLIVFTVWLWMQSLWALDLDRHLFMASLFSKYVLFYAVLYSCLTDLKTVRQFFIVHILGCFYWGFLAWQNPGSGRLENLGFGDVAGSAFASMHISTAMAFAGFAFLGASGIIRWIAFGSLPFMLNAIVLMATRGAFVGLIGGAITALFVAPKAQRKMIVVSLGLGAVLLGMLAHDLFWERMATIAPPERGEEMEESAASRIDIALANLRMAIDYPMGAGHRGNDLLSPHYMPPSLLTPKNGELVRSAHNTLMAVLVDHGFLGLIVLCSFHLSIMLSLLRIRLRAPPTLGKEFAAYNAALITALVIYWGNGQFVNITKAEVVIWIAALAAALHWMAFPATQTVESIVQTGKDNEPADAATLRNPSAQ